MVTIYDRPTPAIATNRPDPAGQALWDAFIERSVEIGLGATLHEMGYPGHEPAAQASSSRHPEMLDSGRGAPIARACLARP